MQVLIDRAIVEQALEALYEADTFHCNLPDQRARRLAAMAAFRAAPAQQAEPVEPVAWVLPDALDWKPRQSETVTKLTRTRQEKYGFTTSLYTAPPQRTMVPLTEEEIDHAANSILTDDPVQWWRKLARAIEKASWEKNNG